MRKNFTIFLIFFIISYSLFAKAVDETTAGRVARNFIRSRAQNQNFIIKNQEKLLNSENEVVSHIFSLNPRGFIAISTDTNISPVVAYSFHSKFASDREKLMSKMLIRDMDLRLKALELTDPQVIKSNQNSWQSLLQYEENTSRYKTFQQWPAQGSTLTGGWITTTWDQSYPYYNFCPLDPNTGQRCVVGCVATAMSMMINYHGYVGDVSFNSYEDSYSTNGIDIDSDSLLYDFPGFGELNSYLDTVKVHYANDVTLTEEDLAALSFACGISVHMNYSSGGSGAWTQQVASALLNKFGYESAEWMSSSLSDFYDSLSTNMIEAKPAEISIRLSNGSGGHAINVDGYNTDDYYHLNFGWGATSPDPIAEAWYDLPLGMPVGYTIITGAVLNVEGGISPLHIGGIVNSGYQDPTGTVITLSGDYGYNATVEDSTGIFQLPAVFPGTYTATATLGRVWYQTKEITLDSLNNNIEFNLFNYERVAGNVQLEGGDDPIGTEIFLMGDDQYSTIVDDPGGDYQIPDVLPGEYTAIASKQRAFYQEKFVIIDSTDMTVDFYLDDYYNEKTMSYHNNNAATLIDLNSEQTIGVATRFTIDELYSNVGDIIGDISFYTPTCPDSANITIKVWRDGSETNPPGIEIYSEEIEDFSANTWQENILEPPIEIAANTEYWIGYVIHTLNGKACWLDDSTIVADKGFWIRPSSSWIYGGTNPALAHNLLIDMNLYSLNSVDETPNISHPYIDTYTYPNPFKSKTNIHLELAAEINSSKIELGIFNIKGQLVKNIPVVLRDNKGTVQWSGKDAEGNIVPTGIYLYKIWNSKESKTLEKSGKLLFLN